MRPVIVIRPEPGASVTQAAGELIGLNILAIPTWEMFEVRWTAPDPANIDALLIGSANALRHSGTQHVPFAGYPVYAVGEATAALARKMGHQVASVGEGGLQAVIDALPATPIRLLRLAGEEHLPLVLPPHVSVETRIVYRALPLPFPEKLILQLRQGALVLLHSAAAAGHFSAECDHLGLPRERIAIAALGPRIAAAAGAGWADCRSAPSPNDAALLALAREMCH